MELTVLLRNESCRKGLYRSDVLKRLARRVCGGEGVRQNAELSVLFCDDAAIHDLNRAYRGKNEPTDVLSFGQLAEVGAAAGKKELVLGDIVISLETVERRYPGDRQAMRDEVRLLFCHGLLHLLGYTHGTAGERSVMRAKQAEYLEVDAGSAWPVCGAPRVRAK
ncbi:MAG: rRNA maturation RNase YbeY [Candidatus Hydrogenedentes bacterium]|nr:rRNA maturation RNase YbeY [Candidatus Hydrogenedentota bacterium]